MRWELGRTVGPLDGSPQSPRRKVLKADLSQGAHPDPGAQGWNGDKGPPSPHTPTLGQFCGLTGVWPPGPLPLGTKAVCPERGGRGAAPRPVLISPSPHCDSGSLGRGRDRPGLWRGRGLDPSQPSFDRTPPGAFRGDRGAGARVLQAVSVRVASSFFPSILSTGAPPPSLLLWLPLPVPAPPRPAAPDGNGSSKPD